MNRTRAFDVAALVLTIAMIGGLGYALKPRPPSSGTVAAAAAFVERPHVRAAEQPSVLFIGDSYTGGRGLPEMSYGCVAATAMGWLCELAAMPGTGYISGGPANRFRMPYLGTSTSFAERIPSLALQYRPDVVVLDGGRNDLFPPREDVFKAMSKTIADVHDAWPDATIVFIRPRFLARPGDDLGFDDAFVMRLLPEPDAQRVVFIDPIHSLVGTDTSTKISSDGIHPNAAGERDLASALVNSLTRSGFSKAMK